MKEYIVLTISNNLLVFNYRTISEEELLLVNKNSFYKDSLYYSLKYYKRHSRKIVNFIFEKFNNTINTIRIVRLITFKYAYWIIEKLSIENLVLDFFSTIDMDDYKMFLESKCIKNIFLIFLV